jgi:hypothetical protein
MNKKGFAALAIILIVVVVLAVVGGIAWVHYYYLPSTSSATTTPNAATPSPETAAAMLAIQTVKSGTVAQYLDVVPTPHTLHPINATGFSKLLFNGIIISFPWTDANSTTSKSQTFIQARFSNGREFTLFDYGKDVSPQGFATQSSSIQTGYDLWSAALNATPDEITNSTPGDEAQFIAKLVILKSTIFVGFSSSYSFSTNVVRGFQFGEASTSKEADINFFDQNDNHYNLLISGTQDEIDYVLASIQPSHLE